MNYIETIKDKWQKQCKIVMLAKGKLNSMETMIPKVWIDTEMSRKDDTLIINEEEKYKKIEWRY